MRVAIVAVALLGLTTSVHAQAAKKPQPASKPDPVAQSYAAMPEAERIAIQADLIWTGDYNGTADAQVGARAVAAVKAFQKRLSAKETGVLNPKERSELSAAAKKKRDAVGWRMVGDSATGVRLGIPGKLAPQASSIIGGSRWASARGEVRIETFRIAAPGTTLQAVYEQQLKLPNHAASYKLLRPDFFVVSGLQSGVKKFYARGEFKDGQVRGFSIHYDQAMEGTVNPVVIAMSSAFAGFPNPPVVITPPPRKKVEYGTAVLVDDAGSAVTTLNLMEGCQTVTLAGYGPADVVARDKTTGLALLRVYGAPKAAPIGLAKSPPAGGVSLVGVADPQTQAGAGAASIVRVRLQASGDAGKATLDPGPALGFEGAAVIDGQGHLAGVVDLPVPVVASLPVTPPQAKLVPASAVGDFLAANKVTPSEVARTSADDQKAAVARVICVRK